MGRRLNSEDVGRAELVRLLNEARQRKALSIRAAARLAGVAPATAQGWLNGNHMPTPALRENFRLLLTALEVNVPDSMWLPESVVAVDRTQQPAPYLGLRPFGVPDREFFFGRTAELERLVDRVRQAMGRGIVVLTAPSGAGKSSLLAAGLIAGATADGALTGWSVETMTPTEIRRSSPAQLIVIDQFEDVFETGSQQAAELVARVVQLAEHAVVVLGLRSGAFGVASEYAELVPALEHAMLLAPMSADQLTEVIVEPARQVGVSVEPELVAALLRDVAPGDASPGRARVLPLLSNMLLALWLAGDGRQLTVADYYRAGGLGSAVENMAESVFGTLNPDQGETARQLFLQLVRVVEGLPRRAQLPLDAMSPEETQLANRFIAARLLTVSPDEIGISHDALLLHWPRLQGWIDESASELRVREKLRQVTAVWVANDRHPSSLLPVLQLPVFADYLNDHDRIARLTPDEQDFLEESQQHFAGQLAAERAMSNLLRRQRRLAVITTALAVVAALVAGIALGNRVQIQRAAQSRQLAYSVRADRAGDTFLQAQVALASHALSPTVEGRSALADALAADIPVRWTGNDAPGTLATLEDGLAGEESLLVKVDTGGEAVLWRGSERTETAGLAWRVTEPGEGLFAVDLARIAGRPIAAIGGQRQMSIWDLSAQPQRLATVDVGTQTIYSARFNTTRGWLLIGQSDGKARLFDLSTLAAPRELDAFQIAGAVSGIAFDPVRPIVYVSGASGAVDRWQVESLPAQPMASLVYQVDGRSPRSQAVATSPDGSQLIAGVAGRATVRWSLDDPTAAPVLNRQFGSWVNSVNFTGADQYVTADSEGRVKVFEAHTDELLRAMSGPAIANSARVIDDQPVAVDALGTVRVWQPHSPVLRVGGTQIYQTATDQQQQRWLAAADLSGDRMLLWDAKGGLVRLPEPVVPAGEDLVSSVVISPDGSWLWGGTSDGKIIGWPLTIGVGAGAPVVQQVMSDTSGMHQLEIDPLGRFIVASEYIGKKTGIFTIGENGELEQASIFDTDHPQSPTLNGDGTMLAVGLGEQEVQLWSLADLRRPVLAGAFPVAALPAALRYSPTDDLLAVGLGSGMVTLWDVGDPARPQLLQTLDEGRGPINTVSFDDQGTVLAAAVSDGAALAWRIDGQRADLLFSVDTRSAASSGTYDVRPILGGTQLVATNRDGQIKLWPLNIEQARQQVCGIAGTELSDLEWARYLVGVKPFGYCR